MKNISAKYVCYLGIFLGAAALNHGLAQAWRPLGWIAYGLEAAIVSFGAAYQLEREERVRGRR